jgi:hypothetical protein
LSAVWTIGEDGKLSRSWRIARADSEEGRERPRLRQKRAGALPFIQIKEAA